MNDDKLEKVQNEGKSHHRHWDELSLDERRASIIRMRNARTKNARKSAVFLSIVGFLFLAATVYSWYHLYKMSLQSNLGIVAGTIVAALGFKVVFSNRVISYQKLFSNDFSDDDINAYFQEEAKVNQRFLEQWNRIGNFIFVVCLIIVIFLLSNDSTEEFARMLLYTGITIFLLGLVVLSFSKPKP